MGPANFFPEAAGGGRTAGPAVTLSGPLSPFPEAPGLGADEAHVVDIRLDCGQDDRRMTAVLDANERSRAARFLHDHVRRRFVVAHAMMRIVLGSYLRVPPESLEFVAGRHGKPELPHNPLDLRFNLSHSEDRALLAVRAGRAIGVDIERMHALAALDLAARFFSPLEHAALVDTPVEHRTVAFFRLWTRKESFVKAIGGGLSSPLSAFTVSLAEEGAQTIPVDTRGGGSTNWTIVPVATDGDYAAALTVEGSGCPVRCWAAP